MGIELSASVLPLLLGLLADGPSQRTSALVFFGLGFLDLGLWAWVFGLLGHLFDLLLSFGFTFFGIRK